MKMRKGFVSNSSSSSFLVHVPKDYMPTDKTILKLDEGYCESEEELLDEVKTSLDKLKNGRTVYQEECNCFYELRELLKDYVIDTNEVHSDGAGYIKPLGKAQAKKIRKILNED